MNDRRWLRVTHETSYAYDEPVELAHHVACLSPRDTANQVVRDWRLTITPSPDGGMEVRDRLSLDAWGNARLVFSHAQVHDKLTVSSVFEAGITAAPPPDEAASPPWEEVAEALRYRAGAVHSEAVEFTLASLFAPRDAALAAFAREAFRPGVPVATGALALMRQIHKQFKYEPAATHVNTRAPEALALKRGVCQDFAHVMIGACRSLGLAAGYVSGYLLTQPPPGKPRLIGADASHAWVAVWCPHHGWIALDPTNNVQAGLDHVTLAWGRDYADVAPLRGVIRGGGRAEPRVAVTVEPLS
ncbi:transglutaminase family protein [Paucibacter sp. R3-3]|uniref:Transglutaminase family protein n=1 Tax=Roseateles agri TaxID=3098619 RepID=A0ABU5DD10_9BURK|nr:transglutaminase family protein [Paucibacter sp. R3-3]MDY0744167.1 transglutaminase family protein [Paucibacter sp. R3-3]